MLRTVAGACAVALSAVACGNSVTLPREDLGGLWRLQSIQRADGSVIASPAETFTLRFAEEFRLEVRADCNACGGDYVYTGRVFDVGPLACTRAFCPTAPFDTQYVQLIEASELVTRTGDVLILRSPSGALRFIR